MSEQAPYTVVVGVSATSKSPTALRWAAAQTAQNHGRLVAVRAWQMPTSSGTTSGVLAATPPDEPNLTRSARRALEADVKEILGPDHGAELRLVRGTHRRVLLDLSEEADLLVIDAPRRLAGEPLFAQRVVVAAACPVVAMPPRISEQPPGAVERAGRAALRGSRRPPGSSEAPRYRFPQPPEGTRGGS